MNAAVDSIVEIDSLGLIIRCNNATTNLFGYTKGELSGVNISLLMPEPYRSKHDGYISRYLDGGNPRIIGIGREVKAQKKDGEVFPVHLSVGEIKDKTGTRFVGIIRDLTEEHKKAQELLQAEDEARDYREKLAHVDRVTTMGEMASGLAHELNQPLTAISSYAQGCRNLVNQYKKTDKEGLVGSDLLTALTKIENEARRASEVIQRIRSFVKKKESTHEVCDCNLLIKDVLKFTEIQTRAGNLEFTEDLDSNLEPIMGDAIQLQQVVLNLIRNAIESTLEHPPHINDKKIVTVKTRNMSAEKIKISIIDNGVGLPEGAEAVIFDPFFTTKESGMGMGLSICDSIVRAHGGTLSVERNSDNKGATFFFTLPTALKDET